MLKLCNFEFTVIDKYFTYAGIVTVDFKWNQNLQYPFRCEAVQAIYLYPEQAFFFVTITFPRISYIFNKSPKSNQNKKPSKLPIGV